MDEYIHHSSSHDRQECLSHQIKAQPPEVSLTRLVWIFLRTAWENAISAFGAGIFANDKRWSIGDAKCAGAGACIDCSNGS
ncbi:MAG TPA: hypothetical protein VIL86_19080 [Tepidisphaeraceae bacterium]